MMKKYKGLLPSLIAVLGAIILIRGIWAMTQPWGNIHQQIFAFLFFFVLFIFALYKVKEATSTSGSPWNSEIMQNFTHVILSVAFVLAGVFVLLTGTSEDRWWAIAGILFFGFGGVHYFRKFMKLKNG